jgi:hypothetical protein
MVDSHLPAVPELVGAKNLVHVRDRVIFMDESADPIPPFES